MVEKNRSNSNSVVSITVGILSILIPVFGSIPGIIGVVLARKAAKEIEQMNEDGRGLATSGLICSSVGNLIQIFVVLSLIAYYSVTNIG